MVLKIGAQSVSEAKAFIQNSDVDSAGNITVEAQSSSNLTANLSNETTAAASALQGATATSYSGILASNAVSGGASAYIDNTGVTGVEGIAAAGDIKVNAADASEITSTTGLKSPTSSSNDGGAGQLNDLAKTLLDDYQYSSASGSHGLEFGDRVRLVGGYANGGEAENVYHYMGQDGLPNVDLSADRLQQ